MHHSELQDLEATVFVDGRVLGELPRRRGGKWTEAMSTQLRAYVQAETDTITIAKALKVDRGTVKHWANKLGLTLIKRAKGWKSPEAAAAAGERMRVQSARVWADPVKRAKMILNLQKGSRSSPHWSRSAWSDPEFKADIAAAWAAFRARTRGAKLK